jgi:hypothetical protein
VTDDDRPEVLDLGVVDEPETTAGSPRPTGSRSAPSRRGVLALAGLAVVGGGVAVAVRPHGATAPKRQAMPQAIPAPASPGAPPPSGEVDVTPLGGPLLDGRRTDVFGLSSNAIVRVELATGRVTTTGLPSLAQADLSFVAVRGGVLVHRTDLGPTYLVPDGRPPVDGPEGLTGPGPMLPGPDLDHAWLRSGNGARSSLTLMGIDGRRTGIAVGLPAYMSFEPMPDGGGYPLVFGVGGAYWARPQGLLRVTSGVVVATGPTGWLAIECDERDRCSGVRVDRAGGRRPVLGLVSPDLPAGDPSVTGVLSPDGRTAALYVGDPQRSLRLVVLDLATGDATRTDLALVGGAVSQSLAWTADGRWLFGVDASARIIAVDPGSGRGRLLVPDTIVPAMPVIEDIAVRPGV